MKKKLTQEVKRSTSNALKKQVLKTEMTNRGTSQSKRDRQSAPKPDPGFTQAVQNYESGLKALQEHKFERAKASFEKVVAGPNPSLADRARVHLNTCNQQLNHANTSFKTPEERYDYAVSLMNNGDYDSAAEHLDKILKQNPNADYALYGRAVLCCLNNQTEDALRWLEKSIKQNPAYRFQARNDSDFERLADDPRFTELLYPEPSSSEEASANSPYGKG
jgi:tetratricopeptide (TPR) repeat protein